MVMVGHALRSWLVTVMFGHGWSRLVRLTVMLGHCHAWSLSCLVMVGHRRSCLVTVMFGHGWSCWSWLVMFAVMVDNACCYD